MNCVALFSGTSNLALAKEVARLLGLKLGKLQISRFPDDETYCRFEECVEGKHVCILQSTCKPGNENLMELLVVVDAAKHSGASKITVVVPYYGYARQDRQSKPGEPVTAALVAKMLKAAGANSIITVDLHSKAVEKALKMQKIHLHAYTVLVDFFRRKKIKNLCVVAPDKGALKNARRFAKLLGAKTAWIEKTRISATEVKTAQIHGKVKDFDCIILDDIISTAGTICEGAKLLKRNGARNVYVAATHGIFAGEAIKRLNAAPIKEVVVTNTISQDLNKKRLKKLKVVSIAQPLSFAIKKISKIEK
ncbi:MAG: ribose-phosphate pyrophosphokinase [Candidatus Diapherotrites archaeon]